MILGFSCLHLGSLHPSNFKYLGIWRTWCTIQYSNICLYKFSHLFFQCEFWARQKNKLDKHVQRVHLRQKNFLCDKCDFRGFIQAELDVHIREVSFFSFFVFFFFAFFLPLLSKMIIFAAENAFLLLLVISSTASN